MYNVPQGSTLGSLLSNTITPSITHLNKGKKADYAKI